MFTSLGKLIVLMLNINLNSILLLKILKIQTFSQMLVNKVQGFTDKQAFQKKTKLKRKKFSGTLANNLIKIKND